MSQKLLQESSDKLLQESSDFILLEDVTVLVGGVDKTNQIDWTSLSIDQNLTKNSDQLSFRVKNYGTKTYVPTLNQEVVVTNNGTKLFGGYVVSIKDDIQGLASFKEITCKDYSFALDNVLIAKTYTSQTVNAIIADLMTNAPAGFTYANVNANVTITKMVFRYVSITECLKKLADYLVDYDWYVDYNKDIHFFLVGTVIAPFNLTDTSQNYIFGTLEVVSDISKMANFIYIRGGKVAASSSKTEYWSGDGTRTQFPLGNDFFSTPTVTVGGSAKTVGLDNIDIEANFQSMWNQDSQLIRFTAGNTPGAGTNNIVISATPRYPLIYQKQNQASVAIYGAKPKLITDKTIQDLTTASQRADSELGAYANPVGYATFVTDTDGLVVGQYINITSAIRNVNQNYKIQAIRISLKTPSFLRYEIRCEVAGSTGINDVLRHLLISNQADSVDPTINDSVQIIKQFPESMAMTETLYTPTTSSPPYVWDTMKWNLFTWS